ncbi:MAG: FAD-dependent oxidoreductase [Acidobacteriota bacterium]
MSPETEAKYLVAVVGAGPAGLYASRQLAEGGAHVALFNRDVKPGGLAEYGIYPNKLKMKGGLRKQFKSILSSPRVDYYGNVNIGVEGDLSLDDLVDLGFQAVLVTVGAQGTKWLGLPGEELEGVYHAKDLVYHYNHLPPFSERQYPIGCRVALIGVGNVMCDIGHWTVRDLKVDEVTAVARRGPAEVKFTSKEWKIFAKNLDLEAFEAEFARCVPTMEAVGQEIEAAKEYILSGVEKGQEPNSGTRFHFNFFSSPKRIVGNTEGNTVGLEVEDTKLVEVDGRLKAKGLGTTRVIEADTVVFCIGDKVDANFGLPLQWNEFAKNPEPRYPVEDTSYEAFDPEGKADLGKIFLAGWAREASTGLVGAARKDGTNGANATLQYLAERGPAASLDTRELEQRLQALDKHVVVTDELPRLLAVEAQIAESRGLEEFKYDSNEEMLEAISAAETA